MKLKYLFYVIYKNGTSFRQNEDDVSTNDPTRSAYYDVRHEEVASFVIGVPGNLWEVNLLTGTFSHNGVPFGAFDQDLQIKRRSLVYFRRHWHVLDQARRVEISHRVTYHFGWEGHLDDGTAVERVLWIE